MEVDKKTMRKYCNAGKKIVKLKEKRENLDYWDHNYEHKDAKIKSKIKENEDIRRLIELQSRSTAVENKRISNNFNFTNNINNNSKHVHVHVKPKKKGK